MKEMWNKRYAGLEYVYGISPNIFFKEVIDTFDGKQNVLFPAEGEGRNAVYAAQRGFNVTAFDISVSGQKKAVELAQLNNVSIDYKLGSLDVLKLPEEHFNVIVLIFAHIPPVLRASFHNQLSRLLAPNGIVILEGFSKNNLERRVKNPKVGGPDNKDLLFSVEEIKSDFNDLEIQKLEEVDVDLKEGTLHNGAAKVIRFIGRKLL